MFLDAEGVIFFSGLEWSVERNELDWNEFVQKSAELSLAFIEKNQVHHEKYLYALDFAEEEERILRSRLPMHFPEMLVNSAYLLDTSGYAEVAWKYEEAIQAIYFYTENHYGILGGDVYECNRESGVPTSDSWYYNFQNHDQSEGIENSKNKAIEYIEKYRKRNGDNYCYTLVVRLFHP